MSEIGATSRDLCLATFHLRSNVNNSRSDSRALPLVTIAPPHWLHHLCLAMYVPLPQQLQHGQNMVTGKCYCIDNKGLNVRDPNVSLSAGSSACPHHLSPRHFRSGTLQQRMQATQQSGHCRPRHLCNTVQAAASTQLEIAADDKWIQRTLSSHTDNHRPQNET